LPLADQMFRVFLKRGKTNYETICSIQQYYFL
jgi:hypothetical protein